MARGLILPPATTGPSYLARWVHGLYPDFDLDSVVVDGAPVEIPGAMLHGMRRVAFTFGANDEGITPEWHFAVTDVNRGGLVVALRSGDSADPTTPRTQERADGVGGQSTASTSSTGGVGGGDLDVWVHEPVVFNLQDMGNHGHHRYFVYPAVEVTTAGGRLYLVDLQGYRDAL